MELFKRMTLGKADTMKVLIAIDSSPSSSQVLEEAVARPWPAGTSFSIVIVVDVQRFARLPALILADFR